MVAEDDVLRGCERRHEAEVLVDHRDPGVERVARRLELCALAEEEDLSLVRPVEAREDVGQRRLAGAVFTQQRMHFTHRGFEVDVIVRDDGGKALRDPAQCDGRGRRGSHSFPAVCVVSPWRYR